METLKRLYVAFIRPHLEHVIPVWDPYLSKDIGKLNLYSILHVRSVLVSVPDPTCELGLVPRLGLYQKMG